MKRYYLDKYKEVTTKNDENQTSFDMACHEVKTLFTAQWNLENSSMQSVLRIQKRAIIGYDNEVGYFKDKIRQIIREKGYETVKYPGWYQSLEDGIYHENWGLASIAEWFTDKYAESSSAKIIGDRVYFLESGEMKLKPQTIDPQRREQLVRAFLLLTPEERMDKDLHEIYLLDGTRVTIFRGAMAKKNQDVMVFRRYIVPRYRFEEQAARGSIPYEAIPFFKAMVKLGFNVAFTGAVRSSKTTFLSTWQSYENPLLEGVVVETDPEVPMHILMPTAPVVQLLADGEQLSKITKSLLRSDADYFIMAEARDGIALDTVIKIASKGTRRMKITFHQRDPTEFCFDVAGEIVKSFGGDLELTANKVAKSFDYIFHFIQLKDRSKKRLKGIYELSFDSAQRKIVWNQICHYNVRTDSWQWEHYISPEKREIAIEESEEAYALFDRELKRLSCREEVG